MKKLKPVVGELTFLFLLIISHPAAAQTATYKDVAVIIDSSSGISDSIGRYFANIHNIPEKNLIYVIAPMTEEIDSMQFENLRQQIESLLISRNLKDSINYIVTTKGVPLKVKRNGLNSNSSVESELSLILGPYASYIGNSGWVNSPYYNQQYDFTRAKFGIYLVTRLDGYSFSDIKNLIDRSSSISPFIPSGANFVLDEDPTYQLLAPDLNNNMNMAADSLLARGQIVTLDKTTTFLTNQSNVLGYVSWGSNDSNHTTNAIPHNTYLPGAIGETYVSTSARSFAYPPVYGQSLIADLIAEGITAVKGYTYEPYSNTITDVSILLSMYVDGYTVAESYYAATKFLSWMEVVIGDPKFRIISTRLPIDGDPLPVQITSFTVAAKDNNAFLSWSTATETNCYGFEIQRSRKSQTTIDSNNWTKVAFIAGAGTSNSEHHYSFEDCLGSPGKYSYRIKQIDNDGAITFYGERGIEIVNVNKKLTLNDNYPNPFNPSTTISFSTVNDGPTSLRIFNILGQAIATLFNRTSLAGETHQVTFDGAAFPSGTYFSRLESGNQSIVKKMILSK
jgi:uncharacterized protein (TIGR03790 family)